MSRPDTATSAQTTHQPRPHRLDFYRWAVQHPPAELGFLLRAAQHHGLAEPLRIREDFAGGAELAATWVSLDPEHQALAVEVDLPTAQFARERHAELLRQREGDLFILCEDVRRRTRPRVQAVLALNFSTLIFHDRSAMLGYFRTVRRSLVRGGVFVMDLFGGPGSVAPGTQSRRVAPPPDEADEPADQPELFPAFTYQWEQRSYDVLSGRIDCRIHFELDGPTDGPGEAIRDAFVYDWRLWSPPELLEMLTEVGLREPTFWCDAYDEAAGVSDGRYRPMERMAPRQDWVAYLTAKRA